MISKENLEELYINKRLSSLEIIKIIGCSKSTVLNDLRKHQIERRQEGFQKGNKNYCWNSGKYKQSRGYIILKMDSHPGANCRGYVFEQG